MEIKKNRKLVAIMFTDIVGYSRMMQDNENKGIEVRRRHRKIFRESTKKYGGQLLQYFGDGTLSIFESSTNAVECALDMQIKFQQDPKVPLRIGIHTGEIIFSEDDAYGHGMNVAARIEPICIPGGIYISKKVNDDIHGHPYIKSKSLGFYELKNINQAIEIFAITNDDINSPDFEIIHPPAPRFQKNIPRNTIHQEEGKKSRRRAALLGLLFGPLGAHRFYLGQKALGIVYFVSFLLGIISGVWFLIAIPAIIGFVDAVTWFAMSNADFDNKYNKGKEPEIKIEEERLPPDIIETDKEEEIVESFTGSEMTLSEKAFKAIKIGDFDLAVEYFNELLQIDPDNEEFHFSLAISYSMLQDEKNGFYHLSKAVEYGYDNFERIQNHFTLAYLRSRKEFKSFKENNYRLIKMLPSPQEDLLDSERPLLLEKLEKLEELGDSLEKGEITEEEFSSIKRQLLSE
jgi:class 3 adenylate cyclase/TM2 domain-containing membrane protein YozV